MSGKLDTLNAADAALKTAVGALISRVDALNKALATAVSEDDTAGIAQVSSDLNSLVSDVNAALGRDPDPSVPAAPAAPADAQKAAS